MFSGRWICQLIGGRHHPKAGNGTDARIRPGEKLFRVFREAAAVLRPALVSLAMCVALI
jgi:hypothetical protein